MAYNWRETSPFYASISGVLAGFSITFIIFLLREDQSSQQLGYGVSWGILSALMMGVGAVLFIQASQYFLTAKDHDVYGMPKEKFDLLKEQTKESEWFKARRNARLGTDLYNIGRIALFLGVTFALWPFSQPVALVVGLGGIGFEFYQIVSAKKRGTHDAKPNQSASKTRRRSLKTYALLTTGAVLLVILNYVFTKLIDLLYGNFNTTSVIIDSLVLILFIFIFTIYISAVDVSGNLARMMGAKDDDN